MSIQSLQSNVQRAHNDIAALNAKLSALLQKEADKSGKIARAQSSLSSKQSTSSLQSKLKEIAQLQKEIASIEKEKGELNKRIGDKTKELHRHQDNLAKEEDRERRKVIEAEKRRRKESLDFQRKLNQELEAQRSLRIESEHSPLAAATPPVSKRFDLFISHASEDKDDFVRPLFAALEANGLRVWLDETQLQVGDSLRRSIDAGLANSRYGVVVLSSSFFAKNWPQYELDGLVAREMNGVKIILPIWHKVTKDEVLGYSPSLADRVALNTSLKSINEIAADLAAVIGTGPRNLAGSPTAESG